MFIHQLYPIFLPSLGRQAHRCVDTDGRAIILLAARDHEGEDSPVSIRALYTYPGGGLSTHRGSGHLRLIPTTNPVPDLAPDGALGTDPEG